MDLGQVGMGAGIRLLARSLLFQTDGYPKAWILVLNAPISDLIGAGPFLSPLQGSRAFLVDR